jgi:hypothetical protein
MEKMKIGLLIGMLAGASALSGCLAVVAGGTAAGTVAYVKGDSEAVVDATVPVAYQTALSVVNEMGLSVINDESDETSAVINCRNAKDEKITITMDSQTTATTRIRVRHGLFGNEKVSGRILTDITSRL